MRRVFIVFIAVCVAAAAWGGCGKKDSSKTARTASGAVSKRALAPVIQNISDNPAFHGAQDRAAASPQSRDIDGVFRPVLKKLFGDARIVAESTVPETQKDGEVVENRITYAVRQILSTQDGKDLHAALRAAGFGASPRLGSKPTTWKGGVVMSLFESTSRRSYSLVINVDTSKQQIVLESYQLGSKYDRLM